jgi:alpha-1,6-mannosyltransferase
VKVCDVTEFYAETSGGVRTYVEAKARHITRRSGWEHVLIVPGSEDSVESSGRSRTYRIKGPRIPGCPPYRLLCNRRKLRAILARERPQVVEVGSPYCAPWLVRWALRGLSPRPALVGFYHSDFPSTYVRPLAGRLGSRLAERAEGLAWSYARRVYRGFEATLAASPHVAGLLADRGIPRVRRVPLGVDLELFHPDRRDPELRRGLGLASGDVLLLYVGRFAPEKGLATLLEAIPLLPPHFRLLLVGGGPWQAQIAAFARRHPAVIVHRYEDDRKRLATLYASADLFVAPGAFETFGLAAVEAQACGLPVVAARGGALPDVVSPAASLLVEPNRPEPLAAAILELAQRDRSALGREARNHVAARFDWAVVLDGLAALYEEAGASGRGL